MRIGESITQGTRGLRRLATDVSTAPYARLAAIWLASCALAITVGIAVASSRSVELLWGIALLLCGWSLAAMLHRANEYAVAVNLAITILLPDVLGNIVPYQQVLILLAANVGVLVATGIRGPVRREDAGLVILLVAVLWQYVVSGSFDTLPGALGAVVVLYATGRLSGSLRFFVAFLLLLGAIHGAVAIAQSVPALSSLIPFQPILNGVPFVSSRATGLFNNPNTLGALEAVVLVTAIRIGSRNWTLPLIVLCAVGLVLSASREGLFGLVVGLSLLGIRQPRQMVVWAIGFIIVGGVVLLAFPSLFDILDPSGYGSDADLLRRYEMWRAATDLIGMSPVYGYGANILGVVVTDNAYLGWLLAGGIAGFALWIVGSCVVTPRRLVPVLAAMFAISYLGNAFSGPSYAAFLSACGAVVADNARQRLRVPGAAGVDHFKGPITGTLARQGDGSLPAVADSPHRQAGSDASTG